MKLKDLLKVTDQFAQLAIFYDEIKDGFTFKMFGGSVEEAEKHLDRYEKEYEVNYASLKTDSKTLAPVLMIIVDKGE